MELVTLVNLAGAKFAAGDHAWDHGTRCLLVRGLRAVARITTVREFVVNSKSTLDLSWGSVEIMFRDLGLRYFSGVVN